MKAATSAGPGPNAFDPASIFVDYSGQLHLRITRGDDGRWHSAEVYSVDPFGYGTFDFELGSRVDQLDRNVVLGRFIDPTGSQDGLHEIDVEITRWANGANRNLNFAVHPAVAMKRTDNITDVEWNSASAASLHRFQWSPGSVRFQSFPTLAAGPAAEGSNASPPRSVTSPPRAPGSASRSASLPAA